MCKSLLAGTGGWSEQDVLPSPWQGGDIQMKFTPICLYPLSALHTQRMLNLVKKDKLELGMLVGTVHVQCNQVRLVPCLLD